MAALRMHSIGSSSGDAEVVGHEAKGGGGLSSGGTLHLFCCGSAWRGRVVVGIHLWGNAVDTASI